MENQSPLKWEVITDVEKLALLSNDWASLNNSLPNSTLFNSPHWLLTWMKQYWQNEWQLFLIIARHEGKLVALAPFYIQPANFIFDTNKLYPLGQGESEYAEISSEYNDILILPEFKKLALKKIKEWILHFKIDQIIWRATLQKSNIFSLLQSLEQHSIKTEATRYMVKFQSWSPKELSKNMRSRYRRGLNQLSKLDAKINWIQKEDFDKYWPIMKEFHQNRWSSKDKKGAFCSNEFNMFHAKFREQSPENIAMSAIWVNEVPVAIHYYFVDSSTLYFYQSGWSESEYSHLSPGLILHLWTIENNNKSYYDFMMGKKQDSYKAKFANQQQPMYNITITFNPIKLMISRVLQKFKLINN